MTGSRELRPAWVLHSRPYRETSSIVEIFAREEGRLAVVARGARGARSKLRGVVSPFQPLAVAWSGRGELRTLVQAERLGPVRLLSGLALVSGFYLNELLMRLLARGDPHGELFDAYGEAVQALASLAGEGRSTDLAPEHAGGDARPAGEAAHPHPGGQDRAALELVLRRFEISLLATLGYGIELTRELESGSPFELGHRYRLDPSRGGFVRLSGQGCAEGAHRPGEPGRGGTGKLSIGEHDEGWPGGGGGESPDVVTVGGRTLLVLQGSLTPGEMELREARRLLRALLAPLLGGRPLRSREMLRI